MQKFNLSIIKPSVFAGLILIFSLTACSNATQSLDMTVDLFGEWSIKLDPENRGISEEWFYQTFPDQVELPGCLQAQGYGEKPGPSTKWWAPLDLSQRHPSLEKYGKADDNFKLIQYLMPRHHYIGAAWYSREINIPTNFGEKHMTLSLERCHWETQVWVDGINIGKNQSLATAHEYDLSQFETGKHKLSIRVDNGEIQKIGRMPHSVSDQTQGTWNGIVGDIMLKAYDKVLIKDIQVYPNIKTKQARVQITLTNLTDEKGKVILRLEAEGYNNGNAHQVKPIMKEMTLDQSNEQTYSFTYDMGDGTQLWDEFDPNLYRLNVSIKGSTSSTQFIDTKMISFGMREFTSDGIHFYVNGIKTYLRGNVDCAVNPKTAYAPMSVERWREIFKTYKEYGLNHARFHSWCPPKHAFTAADELGIYLAPEVHEWTSVNNQSQHNYFKKESAKMLSFFGNHASFVMMGLGNESSIDKAIAQDLIQQWKATDPRHLYTVKASDSRNSGTPAEMDYEVLGHVKDDRFEGGRIRIRYQAFWPPVPEGSDLVSMKPQTSLDWREGIDFYHSKHKKVVITHETAQFCSYPDVFNEMKKYTGYLRPTYLEIAAEQLEERGMTDQITDFVKNSGKWQVLLTREEIEASLRTPGMAGFQWLGLNDFTGQNTAPVGFTDAFYEPKSFVDGNVMRRFCAPTVLLARLKQRVFTSKQTFSAQIELCHFGKNVLELEDLVVKIRNNKGEIIKETPLPAKKYKQGNAQALGHFEMGLSQLPAPAKYNLEISTTKNELVNDYDFWVYPETKPATNPSEITVTSEWNLSTLNHLKMGKTVLLLPKNGTLKGDLPGCFTTFYWTSFGEKGGQSSACGITMDNRHPLFSMFPTETHANWQWYDLLTHCQPMILDQFEESHPWPKSYRPLIQAIDSWKLNRKLALLLEAKIGKGKLIICSMDIENDLNNRPVARQFRHSLFNYIQSTDFNPQTSIAPSVVSALFDQTKPEIKESLQGLPTDG